MVFTRTLALVLVLVSAPSFGNVTSYFNHNPNSSYTEPYRNITRSGDNLEEVIVENINAAKTSVFVAVQEFRLPQIAQALITKKRAGLDVRVVLEHDYNFSVTEQEDKKIDNEYEASKLSELIAFVDVNQNGTFEKSELMGRDAIYMLRDAGVPIIDDTYDDSRGSGLMHHKFMVIDEKVTLVSSANFTMSCVHGDMLASSSRGNPNSLMVVKSAALAKHFNGEFQQLWGNGKRGNFGTNKTYRGPQTIKVGSTTITVQFSPTSARYSWDQTVNGLIAQHLHRAETSVKSALFVYSDQKIGNELEKKNDDGVVLDFLVEAKFVYRNYSEILDMLGLEMLNSKCTLEADNRVWKHPATEAGMPFLPKGDVLHHKFAVIDNKTVIMGSQNWSAAANDTNDETLIVIENDPVSKTYTKEYDRLKRSSLLGPNKRVLGEIGQMEQVCRGMNHSF